MPRIVFERAGEPPRELEVEEGETLRDALRARGLSPHNGRARWVNCRGLGSCGTCAVEVEGDFAPEEGTAMERWRLRFPPHRPERGLRLACQLKVCGAGGRVRKHPGFWGQYRPPASEPASEPEPG
ncbi:MAG TPA: 2Fe-2S iron-sulfur cluster-binding protein [Polyangiaceae bacterium LLY-WYZ-15_(1-7)]|nr:(2Fe-2S)-binding protein [Myxococcales bacterium]MAT24588.1 (2Fe-2S)-binding protein [Sandaracinus sp.]HJL04478.1 2Fe-2S iron-sulfur cluster-binding protein [Polyangiaceae bacterium LLY-WYZ-15_(1-7)]MBJ75363.1 (2Fe-2S)-binding protein [Sandaracinus sp.]HJL08430.1 2Fe-2S iron-sulfur cluster-binding protein [Polyangiaceae bacterium LLY-WYZ-15_(1-7)]